MLAKDVMSKGVLSISSDATLLEAADLLVKTGVSAMPVVDRDDNMVGLVSEADLVRAMEEAAEGSFLKQFDAGPLPDDTTSAVKARRVADVMTKELVLADADATLADVAGLMLKHGVKRIPVVQDGAVVGIVSRVNLLRALMAGDRSDWLGPRSGGWRR
jgi:CBS domain-containing protein